MFTKAAPLLLTVSLSISSSVYSATNSVAPQAQDDHASVVVGINPTVVGDLSANDRYGSIVTLTGPSTGQYGYLTLSGPTGTYSYSLYENTPSVLNLSPGETVTDVFSYTYQNDIGQSSNAHLIVQITGNPQTPYAFDDFNTSVPNKTPLVSGNVTDNDLNGFFVTLNGSPSSTYGYLVLNTDGSYDYTLYEDSPEVLALTAGETITDSYTYNYTNLNGQTASAQLHIQIIGNPVDADGNTVFNPEEGDVFENVDIEFNDRSDVATPLNSGRNIKGHLYHSGDKDWYSLFSPGNEIIDIELCPQGSSCFDKGSWVLYVFDSDKLTPGMEERVYTFNRWVDETGEFIGTAGSSDHMYLAYRSGFFEGALIGVIDPCFGESNSVEIGTGSGAKHYLFAISSPLKGDEGDGCGEGSIVLERPGLNITSIDEEGNPKSFSTTEEYITAFPYRDDQYAIKVTSTGINPLLSETAKSRGSRYDPTNGNAIIPKIRIQEHLYEVFLSKNNLTPRSDDTSLSFSITEINTLSPDEIADAFQATYNPENQQIHIPVITIDGSTDSYSVVLLYHPATNNNDAWLETLEIKPIK